MNSRKAIAEPDQPAEGAMRLRALWPYLATVFAVAIVAHIQALNAGYVLDDKQLLVHNPFVRSLNGLGTIVTSELFAASAEHQNVPYYRPLSGALYWLSFQVLGTDAPLQHGLNILLHAGVATLLLAVLLIATAGRRPLGSLLVTSLFALHPATSEVVAYIGGRQDMLGWCLVLATWGTLASQRKSSPWLWALTAGLTTTLAALTREYFLCAPALLLPTVVLALGKSREHRAFGLIAGGGLAIVGVFGLRHWLAIQSFQMETPSLAAALKIFAGLALRLLQLVVWPVDMSVEVSLAPLGSAAAITILCFLIVITGVTLRGSRAQSSNLALTGFAWAAFWTTVLLHGPVLLKYGYFADRYVYGVLMAAAVAGGVTIQTLPKLPAKSAGLAKLVSALLCLSTVPLAWARDVEWRNQASLQISMFQRRPSDPQSQFAEAMRLFSAGQFDKAYPLCRAYQQARPHSHRTGLCLGTILLQRGQPAQAARYLEPHAYSRPGSVRARVTLFRAWFAAEDLKGVERGLVYYKTYFPHATDIEAAETELMRRQRVEPPTVKNQH